MSDPFLLATDEPYFDDCPMHTDWRWTKICDLCELAPQVARYQLERANDEALTAGYEFKRNVDRNFDPGSRYIAKAFEIFMNRPKLRTTFEGMVLAKVPVELYCNKFGVHVSVGRSFEALFFDVRCRINNHPWICEQLFGGLAYDEITSRDRIGIAHRLAWFCGADFFYSYMTGEWCDEFQVKAQERIRDMLYKTTFINSFCRSHAGEIDIETLRLVVTDIRDQAKIESDKTKGSATETDQADAVMSVLRDLPLSVADPSLKRNLSLPARDPRVADVFDTAVKSIEAEVIQ